MNLRQLAKDQPCIRCKQYDETVVLAHYFGPRRHSYGGGMGHKGHDLIAAHLCLTCHSHMDTQARDKDKKWELSEEMLHYCALTLIKLWEQGRIGLL